MAIAPTEAMQALRKHADDSGSKQILHRIHISHEPGHDTTGLLLRQFPCRQMRIFIHEAAAECVGDLLTEHRQQALSQALRQSGQYGKSKIQ